MKKNINFHVVRRQINRFLNNIQIDMPLSQYTQLMCCGDPGQQPITHRVVSTQRVIGLPQMAKFASITVLYYLSYGVLRLFVLIADDRSLVVFLGAMTNSKYYLGRTCRMVNKAHSSEEQCSEMMLMNTMGTVFPKTR